MHSTQWNSSILVWQSEDPTDSLAELFQSFATALEADSRWKLNIVYCFEMLQKALLQALLRIPDPTETQ